MQAELKTHQTETRGRRFSYELTLKNTSPEPLELLSVAADYSPGATVSESRESSLAEREDDAAAICAQLTEIVNRQLLAQSEIARRDFNSFAKEQNAVVLASNVAVAFPGLVGLVAELVTRVLTTSPYQSLGGSEASAGIGQEQVRNWSERSSLSIKIASSKDAEQARQIADISSDPTLEKVFNYKLARLSDLEGHQNNSNGQLRGEVLKPGDSLVRIYSVSLRRNWLEQMTYPISFRMIARGVTSGEYVHEAHDSITVSASPFVLSTLAILVAVAASGFAPGLAEAGRSIGGSSTDDVAAPVGFLGWLSVTGLDGFADLGQLGLAAFTAFVAFNTYENMEVMKGVPRVVSWRSAIIVGAIAGALTDQVWAAIATFFA